MAHVLGNQVDRVDLGSTGSRLHGIGISAAMRQLPKLLEAPVSESFRHFVPQRSSRILWDPLGSILETVGVGEAFTV